MTQSTSQSDPAEDAVIVTLESRAEWLSHSRNITLIMGTVLVVLASIYDGSLSRALFRLAILIIAAAVMHFKSRAMFGITIKMVRDGRVTVKRWPLTRVVQRAASGHIPIQKRGYSWLIGANRVMVPVRAFPDLDQQIGRLNLPGAMS